MLNKLLKDFFMFLCLKNCQKYIWELEATE